MLLSKSLRPAHAVPVWSGALGSGLHTIRKHAYEHLILRGRFFLRIGPLN